MTNTKRIHLYCSLNDYHLHQQRQEDQEKHLGNHNWGWKPGFRNVIPLVLVVQPFCFACYVCAETVTKHHITWRWYLSFPGKNIKCKLNYRSHHKLLNLQIPQTFPDGLLLFKNWLNLHCIPFQGKESNLEWSRKSEVFDDFSSNNFNFMVKSEFKMLFLFPRKWEAPRLYQEV